MRRIDEMLTLLRLDRKWVEYGFVDDAFLELQCAAVSQGQAGALEHYRIPIYSRFFARFDRRAIPMDQFARYLELCELEPDTGLRSWAIGSIAEYNPLTRAQFAVLDTHPLVVGTKHEYFLARNRRAQALTITE